MDASYCDSVIYVVMATCTTAVWDWTRLLNFLIKYRLMKWLPILFDSVATYDRAFRLVQNNIQFSLYFFLIFAQEKYKDEQK
jgi:hypothetical protein